MAKVEHYNQKVARHRGESWRKALLLGKAQHRYHPSCVRVKRLEGGLTQAGMAKRLGLTGSTYGDMERGSRPVKDPLAVQISQILKAPISALFSPPIRGKRLALLEE